MKRVREVGVTRIFEENEKSDKFILVNRGGARSTKSYSIAQLLIQRFTSQHNKAFLIVRKTMPALRITAYKLILDLLQDYGFYPYCHHNKTECVIKYGDNFMLFTSIEYISRIKSTEWNYVWQEEADEFTNEDFQILKMRMSAPTVPEEPNQMFLSLNPSDSYSWVKTKVIEKEPDCQDILSTYKDNPYLSKAYIKILERLEEQDPQLWRVYGEGEWGVLENLIFHNWDVVREWPETYDYAVRGLDFGFNNPSAFGEARVRDREVWLRELIYESELTNTQLIEKTNSLNIDKSVEIYADSAEPARIEEFYQAGYNIFPADKSIKDGLDYVKRLKLHIYHESINMLKELRGYKYKTDRAGHVFDEPVKYNDHAMDGIIRYPLYSYFKAHEVGGGGKVRFV